MMCRNAKCHLRSCRALFAALVIANLSVSCCAQQDLDSFLSAAIRHAVIEAQTSVVQIETSGGRRSIAGQNGVIQPVTGTVIDDKGHIVAAAASFLHDPAAILVRDRDGTRHAAKIVARNDARQVILLEIVDFDSSQFAFSKAVPATEPRVGQTAIALGKAFNSSKANVSTGIISALGRIDGVTMQTDAKVSANNYGGTLVDLYGHVLGVLVPRQPDTDDPAAGIEWYDSGIGFAVPLDAMRLDQMIAGRSMQRGELGFEFDESDGIAALAVVSKVVPDSPAGLAGIASGDVVTSIDQQPIELLSEFKNKIGSLYAGDHVALTIQRDDATLMIDVVLGEPAVEH